MRSRREGARNRAALGRNVWPRRDDDSSKSHRALACRITEKQGTQPARPAPVSRKLLLHCESHSGLRPGQTCLSARGPTCSSRPAHLKNQPACGVLHIDAAHSAILSERDFRLGRGVHATICKQSECKGPAYLPTVDWRSVFVLSGRHPHRGWPDFRKQARERIECIERNPDSPLKSNTSGHCPGQNSHQPVAPLGASHSIKHYLEQCDD